MNCLLTQSICLEGRNNISNCKCNIQGGLINWHLSCRHVGVFISRGHGGQMFRQKALHSANYELKLNR